MWGSNKLPIFEEARTLDYDHEGVTQTDTRMSKALANDDLDMYDPPSRMLGAGDCPYDIHKARVDGLLESIVHQAIASNACSFDTRNVPRNTQKEDDDHNDIHGYVVPTVNNRNTVTSRMDPLVPLLSNTNGSANPSQANLETTTLTGTWVLTDNYSKEEGSQVVVIQEEEDDQVLPHRHCIKEDQMVLPQGYAEMIVPEEDADQMLVLSEGYAKEKCLFAGDSKDTSHVANENNEMMRVDQMNIWPSPGCQIRTSSKHSWLGQNRGSASINLPSFSRKGKGMMKTAASRKHNKQEQTRRDMINQKMKTLHDLVPYHSRTVKASKESLLTDLIRYIKRLQAQVEAMMSMPSTVPCVMMDYPMATTTRQMSNMYSPMAHPQLHAMCSNVNFETATTSSVLITTSTEGLSILPGSGRIQSFSMLV